MSARSSPWPGQAGFRVKVADRMDVSRTAEEGIHRNNPAQ
jgi:hypothetical protein